MKHVETHFREKQRREKIENIFNKQIRGESYFLCPSFKWKNIVFQQYSKIKQQELSIEQLISLLEKKDIPFGQNRTLIQYPIVVFLEHIAKTFGESIHIN
ncbi:hypothetical protein C6352_30965 [Bacillus thuringiensis]|uniref:hypothetical protein n=1 Tax=Bacillus thuringiensis TaxID=1428 RepID=UPI000D02C9F8|nr:hypothetical protein [Bacillus thuringiensis]PRS98583.1 hypothetical protein C6352_30965 [Bacillus thuringiensis]